MTNIKTKIISSIALGFIGVTSAHAANLALADGSTLTTTIVVGAGDSWEQSGNVTVGVGGFLDQSAASGADGRFRVGVAGVATLAIDGGAVNIETTNTFLLGNGSAARIGTIDLIDGSLNIDPGIFFIGRDRATGIVRIQGGVATFGSQPTFDAPGSNAANIGIGFIDFTTGSTGTLTVAGADQAYYEALYAGDDLTFNLTNTAAFADVFVVSGETLSLVPEPSTTALLGLGAFALILRRRK